jgi:hypothetical protein
MTMRTLTLLLLLTLGRAGVTQSFSANDRLRILEGLIRNRGGFMDDSAPVEICSLYRLLGDSVRLENLDPPILPREPRLFLVPAAGCSQPPSCLVTQLRQLVIRRVERESADNDSTALVIADYRSGEYAHRETFLMHRMGRPLSFLKWFVVEVRQTDFTQAHIGGCPSR